MNKTKRKHRVTKGLHLFFIVALMASFAIAMQPARSAEAAIVNITDGDVTGLNTAITTANGNTEADTINLATGGTYNLETALPSIADDGAGNGITINGNGATVRRGDGSWTCPDPTNPEFIIFNVLVNGELTLNNVTVLYGCGRGGGVYNAGTVNINNSSISDNAADNNPAGGITNRNTGTMTITNSTVSRNTADGGGGGITNNYGTLTIANSTISGNTAKEKGGGICSRGALTIVNSTISGNTAKENGGGICSSRGGALTVINSTITNNTADSDDDNDGNGGGIHCTEGTVTLKNTIVAGNTDGTSRGDVYPDISGDITGNADNLIGDTTGGEAGTAGTGSDIVNPAPGLGALADNGGPTQTHALLTGSPALNAVTDCTDVTTDQRGVARPQGPGCDIGAFEVVTSQSIPTLSEWGMIILMVLLGFISICYVRRTRNSIAES